MSLQEQREKTASLLNNLQDVHELLILLRALSAPNSGANMEQAGYRLTEAIMWVNLEVHTLQVLMMRKEEPTDNPKDN